MASDLWIQNETEFHRLRAENERLTKRLEFEQRCNQHNLAEIERLTKEVEQVREGGMAALAISEEDHMATKARAEAAEAENERLTEWSETLVKARKTLTQEMSKEWAALEARAKAAEDALAELREAFKDATFELFRSKSELRQSEDMCRITLTRNNARVLRSLVNKEGEDGGK